ncbi:MAG: beta-N-acetylhexosaminidase [Actinobacteria bacterium]|nr:beta-N-acetylhexosaminidase [Actinomycetota bacterium]
MTLALVPYPASLLVSDTPPFRLTPDVAISGDPAASAELSRLLLVRTGLSPALAETGPVELRIVTGGVSESYTLSVTSTGIRLSGSDAAGLFYGVQTLGQLLRRDDLGWSVPAVEIEDAPRFAYRGAMLDVARHFFPVSVVKGFIDRAAALKLNHLHLHLTDDQGWRLHLDARPRLTEMASDTVVGGGPGGFYTKADYRDLVAYAASRHVTVVPEIDVPGHTHAVALAYPEIAEAPVLSDHVLEVVESYGGAAPAAGEPYSGMAVGFSSLKIHDEATYDFLADVFGELAALTPGPYLHVGGDEALGTAPDDFAEFMARATALVADLGKIPLTWHEAGAAPGLDPATVGQYWGLTHPTDSSADAARSFARNGSSVILSPADAVYLDMKYDTDTPLGLTWANGPTSVERSYSWEPATLIAGIGDHDILGVEAPLWTETTSTAADLDIMAFPRITSAAEIAWSPAPGASTERTWTSFRQRIGALAPLWTLSGIGFFRSPEIDWITE